VTKVPDMGGGDVSEARGERSTPVYAISVVAQLCHVPVPTLRLYERHGLVEPARTEGGTRRYSEADVERIRRVSALVEEGYNLAAVARLLTLEHANDRLEVRIARLIDHAARLESDIAELRRRHATHVDAQPTDEPDDGPVRRDGSTS
jgi:MerR family transcriptional regulator/heat shock protein HspR